MKKINNIRTTGTESSPPRGESERGLNLEWVPTWEGVLQYCPDDLRADRPLHFWRVRTIKGKKVRYQLKISFFEYTNSPNISDQLRKRRRICFWLNGKVFTLYCSHLTMLCITGFAIADRRHWSVDHINGNTMDDRPSNLQVISQKENVNRSRLCKETNKLSPAERHRRCQARIERMNKLRLHLMAIMPEASKMDIEMEVALQMMEHNE